MCPQYNNNTIIKKKKVLNPVHFYIFFRMRLSSSTNQNTTKENLKNLLYIEQYIDQFGQK
jgi:hypothetical protein